MSRRQAISRPPDPAQPDSSHPTRFAGAPPEPGAGPGADADARKAKIRAMVSHELRTPLTSIIGYAEILLEELPGPLNEEQRRYVATVMDKGEQLLAMITGLMEVSRVASGALRVASEPLAISEALDRAAAAISPRLAQRRVDLELPPRTPLRVHGDRHFLSQVFFHILDNAVKFTPDGGAVSVCVRPAPLPSEPRADGVPAPPCVHIAVTDTGIGIARDHHERIFDPFFQVDSSSTRHYGGSGLGLALAKSYAEAQGGRIRVDSDVDMGSTFTVSLPVASEELSAQSADKLAGDAAGVSSSRSSGGLHGLGHSG